MSNTTSPQAGAVVTNFFDAYRAQDVERMVDLCSDNADFHYIPIEGWGRQRVIYGDGKVRTIGKTIWTQLIDSFPDLTNEIHSITSDTAGNVAVECTLAGTQKKPFGSLAPQGKRFAVPHVFLFKVDGDGLIDEISAYWDGADLYRQLGRLEVD
jgi:steroid delta-isomerase-like uncharacterized protein